MPDNHYPEKTVHTYTKITITPSFNTVFLWKIHNRDFPGGPVVKNPLCNPGYMGLIPGLGNKIPHAAGQLSPCATTKTIAAK